MRGFRWLFITAGIVVLVGVLAIVVGTVWLNSFLHSDAFRLEVQTKATQTLGGPVEIRQINLGFLGVKLEGVGTKIDSSGLNGQGALVATVESINCRCSLIDLLFRRLKLTGVTLDKPQIVLTRQAASTVARPPLPTVPEAGGKPTTPGGTAVPFQFILEAARLKDGSLSIRDATGTSMADFEGINVEADTSGYYDGKDVTGKVRIATLALPSNLQLTDFTTPFAYRTGAVEAKSFEVSGFKGKLTGDYTLDASGPSTLNVEGKGLDLEEISRMSKPSSSTRLSGLLNWQSRWRGVETGKISGEGDAQITNGRLEGVTILQDLAMALRLKELNAPVLRTARTHFQVADGTIRFTGLQIDASVFQMSGDGVIDPQGNLSANMVLTLNGRAMGGIPGAAAAFFSKLPGGGASIPFHIAGTVSNPRADLSTRMFIQNSKVQKTIGNAVKNFFK